MNYTNSRMTILSALLTVLSLIWTSVGGASEAIDEDNLSQRLQLILKPYVAELDRDLWTFRYEGKDKFQPTTPIDLIPRIANWANRFSNVDILSGADTGPGVYVATDPVATATWGGVNPRLFAIKIKKGTRVLIGDQPETPATLLREIDKLAIDYGCGQSSTQTKFGLGNVVGYFRMNKEKICRKAIITAIQNLGVEVISYGFYSVPLANCRVTGTALSIINSNAVSLSELNRYSEDGNVLGQPKLTPFFAKLFNEAKSDYYSQSLLANPEVRNRFKRAYGFFEDSESVSNRDYLTWRSQSILKCGGKWSIEAPNPGSLFISNMRRSTDPEIAEVLIRISLLYRERYEKSKFEIPVGTTSEFHIEQTREIRARESENSLKTNLPLYALAKVPRWSGDKGQDKKSYLNLLNKCLGIYENETVPFSEIVAGPCGVINE